MVHQGAIVSINVAIVHQRGHSLHLGLWVAKACMCAPCVAEISIISNIICLYLPKSKRGISSNRCYALRIAPDDSDQHGHTPARRETVQLSNRR